MQIHIRLLPLPLFLRTLGTFGRGVLNPSGVEMTTWLIALVDSLKDEYTDNHSSQFYIYSTDQNFSQNSPKGPGLWEEENCFGVFDLGCFYL